MRKERKESCSKSHDSDRTTFKEFPRHSLSIIFILINDWPIDCKGIDWAIINNENKKDFAGTLRGIFFSSTTVTNIPLTVVDIKRK